MFLHEAYGKVEIGKDLSDAFPVHSGLKLGDCFMSLLFNFAL